MHFLTSQSESEQVSEVCQFLTEHLRQCVKTPSAPLLDNFEKKMQDLDKTSDAKGVLEYLLQIQDSLITLPT